MRLCSLALFTHVLTRRQTLAPGLGENTERSTYTFILEDALLSLVFQASAAEGKETAT